MKSAKRASSPIQLRPWTWVILIIGLAMIIYGIITLSGKKPDSTALAQEVSVSQAASLRDQGAFVLDVREPDEWAAGHIAGATLIPLGELASRMGELPKDKAIVVVCQSGRRSAQGRDILLGNGFAQVTSMGGGMSAWVAQGLAVVAGP